MCPDIVIKIYQIHINSGNICDLMSTLKMVLHVEKTLKITIQKKLPKSQKFAGKLSAVEFRYSQTIFLRFTVILLYNNFDEKITSI